MNDEVVEDDIQTTDPSRKLEPAFALAQDHDD
jgi:hypothetical protein